MRLSSLCSADELQTQAYTPANPFIKEQVINRESEIECKTEQGCHRFNNIFFFKANLRKCNTGQG